MYIYESCHFRKAQFQMYVCSVAIHKNTRTANRAGLYTCVKYLHENIFVIKDCNFNEKRHVFLTCYNRAKQVKIPLTLIDTRFLPMLE